MTAPITLKNIGPITALSLPIPEGGGVVVLRGKNGTGKSTALDAITAAVTGKGKPPLKDLAERGEVNAGGVKLTVGRSVRRTGELEVATLEGRLSVADLVDPGISAPSRADATRIKALVGLAGAALEAADLHGFPPEMLDGLDLADPVAAMAELKQRLDIGGREYEKLAKAEGDRAAALLEAAGEVTDEAAPMDEAVAALTEAQRRFDRLVDMKNAAVAAKVRMTEARAKLAELPTADVAAAESDEKEKSQAVEIIRATAQRLKEQYNAIVAQYRDEIALLEVARERTKTARRVTELRREFERQIVDSDMPGPTDDVLAKADSDLTAKRAALAEAERARQAAKTRQRAMEKAQEADRLAEEASVLRRKARQTDEVLSEIVADLPGCPLRVSNGRLVTDTSRGPTMFAELSHGERWRMALDIAINAVGETGLIVIPQEAWEGLDSENRDAVAAQAKAGGVVVITAECGDGPLAAAVG